MSRSDAESVGGAYVARCPQLDVASQGLTVAEARQNLAEALALFFETASASEIDQRLSDSGDSGVLTRLTGSGFGGQRGCGRRMMFGIGPGELCLVHLGRDGVGSAGACYSSRIPPRLPGSAGNGGAYIFGQRAGQ